MIEETEIPGSLLERALMMEGILVARATGGDKDNPSYKHLRREFMGDSRLESLLPPFVRTYRDLEAFWSYIKELRTYDERKLLINEAFTPLINYLEERNRSPSDKIISDTLESFDVDGAHIVWVKALERRNTDPEGAITVARTLLETVIKRILDEIGQAYPENEDLPKLYANVAQALNLAPNQHTEEPIKAILGSAMNLVNGIGTLRNRFSDSHGRGGTRPVKPLPRHATLAVNTAGIVATFLIETHLEQKKLL